MMLKNNQYLPHKQCVSTIQTLDTGQLANLAAATLHATLEIVEKSYQRNRCCSFLGGRCGLGWTSRLTSGSSQLTLLPASAWNTREKIVQLLVRYSFWQTYTACTHFFNNSLDASIKAKNTLSLELATHTKKVGHEAEGIVVLFCSLPRTFFTHLFYISAPFFCDLVFDRTALTRVRHLANHSPASSS